MCESIAHFNTRDLRDKRLHAHAARTEHVPWPTARRRRTAPVSRSTSSAARALWHI